MKVIFFKVKEFPDQKVTGSVRTTKKARVTTVNEDVVKVNSEHNHTGDAAEVEAAKIFGWIRCIAKTTKDASQRIISSSVSQCPAIPNCLHEIVFIE